MIKPELKQQIKDKQQEYLLVKAEIMTMEEINTESKQKVLNKYIFIDDKGNRITDSNCDWLISDKEDLFKAYLKVVAKENIKAGLKIDDPNKVIAWEEKDRLKKIENELLELQLLIIPKKLIKNIKQAQKHWKYREKALDLILRLEV